MYRLIRTAAYEVEPDHGPVIEAHHMMRPDPAWWAELAERYRSTRRSDPAYGLPTKHLGSLLCALAPGVVTADAQAASTHGDTPWLYAREHVPDEVVVPLIDTWATDLLTPRHTTTDVPGTAGDDSDDEDGFGYWYENGTPEHERADCEPAGAKGIEHLLEQLYEAPPAWTTQEIDLTASATSPAGTALPGRHVYRLLTEWAAARLTARPWHVRGRTLRFKAVTDGERSELVSWPPLRHVTHRRAWYYSARLSVTVQTVPFHGRFRVHVSPGIRRWVTGSGARPGPGRRATVLIDAPLPWADSDERTPRLIGNSVGYDHRLRRLAWQRRSTAKLLPHVDIVRTFPDPEELFRSPEDLLLGRDSFRAGITYHPTMQGTHRIGPGLMPRERAELDEWVAQSLAPVFRRVPDLTRINRVSKPLLRRTADPDPDRRGVTATSPNPVAAAAAGRRQALHDVLGEQPLRLDVVWHSKEVRDEVLHALPELLGLPHPERTSRDEWTSEAHGLTVRMHAIRRGGLGGPLKLPQRRGLRRAVSLGQAITARAEQVAGSPATLAHATVIELDGRARYPRPGTDPKHALRLGFAAAGKLTQFIQPPGEEAPDLGQRARSACLDVLRQIGAVPFPPHQAGKGVPENLQYVGLWLVRHTSRGPTRCATRRLIALRIRPGDHEPVHGWDDIGEAWVPYRRLLLTLASDRGLAQDEPGTWVPGRPDGSAARWNGFENPWREDAQRQIQNILFQTRDRPTLLLASAGNLRQCWPGIASAVLTPDELAFGAGEPGQRLSLYGPDLRFVLLRDANGRGEVPQWWARDETGATGFSAGLWTPGHTAGRVFYSTADVPHTAARPKGLMKLVPDADGRTAPTKNAWNPRGLEITVAGCLSAKALADAGREQEQPDDPADWAMLAHQLRFHDSYSPLAWPLPLHLAKLAGEYVLPLAKEHTEARP